MRPLRFSFAFMLLTVSAGAGEVHLEVRFRSASTVYLAGGSADGLAAGDRLAVVAGKETIGELEVDFVAEHSSSCKVIRETRPVKRGDMAVLSKPDAPALEITIVDSKPGAEPAAAPVLPAIAESSTPLPWARARGGASFGWYRLWDRTPSAFVFEQRTARVDLGLWDIAGRPLQVNVRARSRQDLRARPFGLEPIPRDERRDRLYELSLRYDPPDGRFAFEAGRLGASPLGIGYLDGVLGEVRGVGSLRLGGFFGNRVEVDRVTGSAPGRKYGGYLRLAAGGAYWPGSYDALLFGARELAGSEPSREYVGYQGRLGSRRFSFFQWVELDLLRGWREVASGRRGQLSNVSLAASYRFSPRVSVAVSYDQRRNYPTAETRDLPSILFDTFLRQGFRASFDATREAGFGLSGFFGTRFKDQSADTAYSFGGGLRHPNLLASGLSGHLDASGFTSRTTQGYQASARLGRLMRGATFDVGYGISGYTLLSPGGTLRLNHWLRFSGRAEFPRGLWLYGEAQYDRGDDVSGPRGAFEVGYRF